MTLIKLICQNEKCKKEFEVENLHRNHKYCSSKCYHNSGKKGKPPKKEHKKCIVCNKEIPLVNQRFCSVKCKVTYWKDKEKNIVKYVPEERVCPICNNIFFAGGRGNKKKSTKYCSRKCQGISKQKEMNDSNDLTRSRMWRRFRKEIILERKHECEFCNIKIDNERKIQLHHIIPIKNGGNNDKSNLMILCLKCHAIIEHLTKIGYKHNKIFDPIKLIELLKNKIYNIK